MGWSAGHGSWLIVVPLAIGLVMRTMARPGRRRGGRPTPPPHHPPAAVPPAAAPPGGAPPSPTAPAGRATPRAPGRGIPAGWLVDPSGRYQQRYWSGSAWTDHVRRDGVDALDPFGQRPGPASASPGGPVPPPPAAPPARVPPGHGERPPGR